MKKEVLLAAILLMAPVCGCSKEEEPAAEVEKVEEVKNLYDLTVGKETTSSQETVLKNDTGLTIKSWQIKTSDKEEFGQNLFGTDKTLSDGQTMQWFYTPGTSSEDQKYDIKIVFDDDNEGIIHNFRFGQADGTIDLHINEGIVYLTYTNTEGEPVDTLEAEQKIEEASQEPANDADNPAQDAEVNDDYVEEYEYYEEGYAGSSDYSGTDYYEEPAWEPVQEPVYVPEVTVPDTGSQGSDPCLGDGVATNPDYDPNA